RDRPGNRQVPAAVSVGPAARGEDRDHRAPPLRRGRRLVLEGGGEPPEALREAGLREFADQHRQDAVLLLGRPEEGRTALGIHAARRQDAALRGRGLRRRDLRRHHDDARIAQAARRRDDRRVLRRKNLRPLLVTVLGDRFSPQRPVFCTTSVRSHIAVTASRSPLVHCCTGHQKMYRVGRVYTGVPTMLTLEVRRRPGTGAEAHRVAGVSATAGASSGNEVVVRARGVYGRHVRLFERDGRYHLDLFKGIETVQVNGRDFFGGAIAAGDRITIGEATITVVDAAPGGRPGSGVEEEPTGDTLSPGGIPGPPPATPGAITIPVTEVEYRSLRQTAYRICRASGSPEDLATELTDFLDRELPPSEWAVGEFSAAAGFRPLASTFRENPMLPPRMLQDLRSGERLSRAETVTGTLTLVVEPPTEAGCAGILVRESPRLAARAVLFLEELVQIAGLAFAGMGQGSGEAAAARPAAEAAPPAPPPPE